MPAWIATPSQVRRCMNGIGALSYRLLLCFSDFCRIGKTPTGVSLPSLPVETVDAPISIVPR